MRTTLVLVVVAFATLSVAANAYHFYSEKEAKDAFEFFKFKHHKKYRSTEEHDAKFLIFRDNLARAELYQSMNPEAKFGVTKYSDMTPEQFKNHFLNAVGGSRFASMGTAEKLVVNDVPASVDWRQHDPPVINDVKDQGQCGSCWAFSGVGVIEMWNAISTGNLVNLAEQQVVDCDTADDGCDGGEPMHVFDYAKKGLMATSDYPYTAQDGKCVADASKFIVKTKGHKTLPKDENNAMAVVATQGPISIAIDASPLQYYQSGIYAPKHCPSSQIDHAVIAVGYNNDPSSTDTPYWIVRNSWGSDWGEDGYFRMKLGVNQCGITADMSVPMM